MRLSSGERWDTESLAFACDMFLMPVDMLSLEQGHSSGAYWYPTLTLNLEIKKDWEKDQGPEWLFLRNTCKQIRNGRMDIDVVIMDEQGELVALSNHVALIVSAERNLGKRGGGEPEAEGSKL